jgi:4-hydroxybenzoate polyprenyltransferase
MLPDDLYKRRHYGTPQSILLIMANYVVFAVATSLFASSGTINIFFWIVMGVLAIYNFTNIRKDREQYNRIRIIAYVVSVLLLVVMFILLRIKVQNH